MATADELRALLARVEGTTGPDRRLDYEIFRASLTPGDAYLWDPKKGHFYTASIDAAVALVERMLPGAYTEIGVNSIKDGRPISTAFISLDDTDLGDCWGLSTAPLAILAALLKALLAQSDPQEASHVG